MGIGLNQSMAFLKERGDRSGERSASGSEQAGRDEFRH